MIGIRTTAFDRERTLDSRARAFHRALALALLALVALPIVAMAHAGEDHGDAAAQTAQPASVAGMQGEILTTSGTTDYFEIVAKYPATDAGDDTRLRLFIADYATNAPIGDAALALSFTPAGVVVREAPHAVSPGVYDLVVRFPEDTVYALVATVTSGQRTDFVEVRNIYAGAVADRFLAEHASPSGAVAPVPAKASSGWLIPAIVAAALALVVVAALAVRRRRRGSVGASVARDPDLSTQPDPSQPPLASHPDPSMRPGPSGHPDPSMRPGPSGHPDPSMHPDPAGHPDPSRQPDPSRPAESSMHPEPPTRPEPPARSDTDATPTTPKP